MKTEHLLIIVALSIGVIFYFFADTFEPTSLVNYPPKNDTIVAFGDSLIQGYGATPGNDFISLLAQKIKKPIINLGVSGNTTGEGLARINEVIINNPGTVIVLFGGNDYLRNISEQETFANLHEIITRLQSQGAFVVLLGVQGGVFSDHFRASFEKLAGQTGVVYVPNVLDGLFGDSRYMSGVVHPNDAGYAKIADKIYTAIGKYLQ